MLPAFGLVDALVGLFLLLATSVVLFSGFSTLMTLAQRQDAKAEALVKTIDAESYGPWL